MKCYVVGDIHGCLDELSRLLEELPLEDSDRLRKSPVPPGVRPCITVSVFP